MSIESNIKDLKNQIKKYDELSDYDKIMGNHYADIIDEKENAVFMLNDYKNKLNEIGNRKSSVGECDDDMFKVTMDRINVIKQKIGYCGELGDMIKLYEEINNCNQILKFYFNNKKMEIINV